MSRPRGVTRSTAIRGPRAPCRSPVLEKPHAALPRGKVASKVPQPSWKTTSRDIGDCRHRACRALTATAMFVAGDRRSTSRDHRPLAVDPAKRLRLVGQFGECLPVLAVQSRDGSVSQRQVPRDDGGEKHGERDALRRISPVRGAADPSRRDSHQALAVKLDAADPSVDGVEHAKQIERVRKFIGGERGAACGRVPCARRTCPRGPTGVPGQRTLDPQPEPPEVLHDARAAASFSLTIDGVEIGSFSELAAVSQGDLVRAPARPSPSSAPRPRT